MAPPLRLTVVFNEEAQIKVEELKSLYEKDFGIDISYSAVLRMAVNETLKLLKSK